MASINWGIGWVHPTSGSSGNNGYGPDTPKDTIQNAISAGFDHIRVAAGTHTVSSITERVTLEFMPGTHTFTNAPVSSTRPLNLISSMRRPPALTGAGAAKITAPAAVDSFFSIQNAPTPTGNLYGMMVRGLWFDFSKLNSGGAAVEFMYMNQSLFEDCIGYEASYGGAYLWKSTVYAHLFSGNDQSWNRYTRNTSWNGGMWTMPTSVFTSINRAPFIDNVTVYPSGNGTHRPYNVNETRIQGVLFEGNTIDGTTADTATYWKRGFDYVVIGNHTKDNTGVFFWADQTSPSDWPMSSHFIHALGIDATGGNIRIGTSDEPTAGTETNDTVRKIRTDLIDWNNNL